jgi:hypothetical protein
MTGAKWDKLKAGNDDVCWPSDYDGPKCSISALRSLFIAYLYIIDWAAWKPRLICHGGLVSDALGVIVNDFEIDMPRCVEWGILGNELTSYHPNMVGERVLVQVHPAFVNRGLAPV